MAAQIPRKRSSWKDPIQHTLRYWSFLDDRRSFSHLDALLTRVAPLSVLHLGCTEKMEVRKSWSGNDGGKDGEGARNTSLVVFLLSSQGSVDGFLLVLVMMLTDNHIFLSLPLHSPTFTFTNTYAPKGKSGTSNAAAERKGQAGCRYSRQG